MPSELTIRICPSLVNRSACTVPYHTHAHMQHTNDKKTKIHRRWATNPLEQNCWVFCGKKPAPYCCTRTRARNAVYTNSGQCTARCFYRRRAHVEACSKKCYVHIDIDIALNQTDFPHVSLGLADMFLGLLRVYIRIHT